MLWRIRNTVVPNSTPATAAARGVVNGRKVGQEDGPDGVDTASSCQGGRRRVGVLMVNTPMGKTIRENGQRTPSPVQNRRYRR